MESPAAAIDAAPPLAPAPPPRIPDPHASSVDEIARRLHADPERGLAELDAAKRLTAWGPNEMQAAEPISAWRILAGHLTNVMTLLLFVAGLVALGVWWMEGATGVPGDALVIAAVVVLNTALGFVQEFRAERAIRELKRMASAQAQVIREGRSLCVERRELVPGDLVVLEEGARVPADLVLVRAASLRADESVLTGESRPVSKRVGPTAASAPVAERAGMVFAGTSIAGGAGLGLAVATGDRTELGGIASTLATTDSEPTPLERRLGDLSRTIGIGVVVLAAVVAASILWLQGGATPGSFAHVLMFAVALAVAAVPEGLPTVLTVSLSLGARRLARRKAVVRRLSAVETLGSVTTIVTDKTGTLTRNETTARRLFVDGRERTAAGADAPCELTLIAGALSSRTGGDPIDAALVALAATAGIDVPRLSASSPVLAELPFSSERARSSCVRRFRGEAWSFVKGSLAVLEPRATRLARCALDGSVRFVALDAAARRELHEAESRMAGEALRAIAIAARPMGDASAAADPESDLVLLGLVGFGDPLRPEVPAAIETCRRAGIEVVMLTGDHPATAAEVAREAGLAPGPVRSGSDVERVPDAALDEWLQHTRVFARVSPQAKLRIVERLLARGDVVAMTGDGVNDAPALKRVHVGVAMGRSGTAVAVEASDIVLLDDNFATLVAAIEGGRSVYANVQRFIAFLFSGNAGVVLAMFLGALAASLFDIRFAGELLLPLTAAQILWMNLVTDGAPAVAFSLGRPGPGEMDRPPRAPDAPIVGLALWSYVLVSGASVAALLLGVLDAFHAGGLFTLAPLGHAYARSAAFYTVVVARLFNALNFSGLPGSAFTAAAWRTWQVPAACLVSWAMTLAMMGTEPGRTVLGLVPLAPAHLLALTALAALVLVPGAFAARLASRMDGVR